MMELSHSLTLNEEALAQLPPAKRPIFVFEWLRFLDKVLEAAHKSDIKECQKQLVAQLVGQMNESPGPPTRKLVARCLATLFSVGDTFLLFDTINKCNDVLKNKDDSPSYLPTRLAAVTCIGAMYEKLGRMMGRSYEETVQILIKALRNAESQLRIEIMMTLEKITAGMGTAAGNVHKDIYKAAKMGLTDRALPVRCASALCLMEMTKHAPFMYTTEIENLSQLCYRAFDNSNYDVRCTVAKLLGFVLATTQNPPKEFIKGNSKGGPVKLMSLDEALTVLLTGFLRGGNSFLKGTGEMIKGSSSVSREVRVGITQVTLEGRAGALASMHSFLLHCSELAAEDTVRRLLLPIEAALLIIAHIVKQYGQHLKASTAMVRLRLYEVLALLPPQSFESHYTSILKLLVSEFTLAESGANTTTSLLRSMCHADDSVILGTWLHHTHHKAIEDQLQPNSASGSGALEHDSTYLYRPLPEGEIIAGPLPLGVAVIDASVVLFGQMFPLVANKHRLKVGGINPFNTMLNLFGDMIRAAKSQRQEAVQMNIFTAVLSALKILSDNKASFGQDDVKKAATALLLGGLIHPNSTLRCASGEAIGRMAQVVGDPRFVAELAQNSFDKLKSARDAVSRTGHSLALGCLHRYVGGMGSGQHLSTSISILLALAKDTTSPVVQVWALHALSLIADSGGPMFRSYVEPSLALLLELLLSVPLHTAEVHQCIGKCLQALITTVGPELQGTNSSVVMVRWSLLCGCGLVQEHPEPLVQAEAIACLQQMHMFAPRHVNLSSLVPMLVKKLSCNHLLLRRAAVSCLRQLSQREAWEVCEHALNLAQSSEEQDQGLAMTETGLPGLLFGLLDTETDCVLVRHVHHTLTSMLQALATSHLTLWLTLCQEVLTNTVESSTNDGNGETGEEIADDDMVQIHTGGDPDPHPTIPPRWTTRVFAAQCIAKIIQECENSRAHFDLALAREMQATKLKGDYLVLHLSEVVRMGFMGATSDSDELRLEGLHILHLIIDRFSHVPEPEFPGHVILEQYQAQVGAALRPAFAPETASHVTARACEVCSAWICSGVARDLNDLRRVHQLLVSSLAKLNKGNTKGLYNESAATLEKLAILKAWAEVYAVALKGVNENEKVDGDCDEDDRPESDSGLQSSEESLLSLVQPELVALSKSWLAALKDHALLSLPPEFSSQLPHDGGAFYSNESIENVRPYYRSAWPPMLYAAALWLSSGGFDSALEEEEGDASPTASMGTSSSASSPVKTPESINKDRFYLLLGICLEWLCSPVHSDDPERSVVCLRSLETLLSSHWPAKLVGPNSSLTSEIATVMHRQVLSSDHTDVHQSAVTVVTLVVKAAQQTLDEEKRKKNKHKGSELVGVLVGLMVGALQDTNRLSSVNQPTRQLHQYALGRLQKIGPQYPQEFRTVLTSKPELRLRLEGALKGQQEAKSKVDASLAQDSVQHQPTIKLKRDFSNFALKT
ncbi:HEAT repeat-containing protein 5B [Portunus trituberculatus]|uniref:HEAT repeat-containing protein 5B n=1 Tax=Portunus trituberculatus TaxID=210409 RepID=A0A5B7CVW8_PORTR|nr:HEAT repeat-containing protein 5B [Portunus trituberculatus]